MNFKRYQAAIEESNIVSKTDIDGIITFVNDEFCKISGYSRDELIGINHNIVRHPDVPKKVFEKLWKNILNKKVHMAIVKNKAKDGSAFYVNTTIIPMLNSHDEIKEFIAIRHDVTQMVLLNEELAKKESQLKQLNLTLEQRVKKQTMQLENLNKNLENKIAMEVDKNNEKTRLLFQQSRLASMGEMIGNIAHQWCQPLSELGIDLFKMKKDFRSNNEISFLNTYSHAKTVINRMSQTIDDFRNFFNTNKTKKLFSVEKAIRDSIEIMSGTLEENSIKIKLISEDNVKIYGYESEFTQVIMNLINNAKDAFKDEKSLEKRINIKISKDNNNIFILVEDNAKGVNKEIIEKIFEPYFTTKHPSSGTGLGLYMSKMIIETSMKGEINVSNLKKGACFSIMLPVNLNSKQL